MKNLEVIGKQLEKYSKFKSHSLEKVNHLKLKLAFSFNFPEIKKRIYKISLIIFIVFFPIVARSKSRVIQKDL